MAKQEHLSVLKEGVTTWNQWRKEHPQIQPDLRDAHLHSAHLRNADLHNADLRNADLREAILVVANLRGANLLRAVLSGADLSHAFLSKAHLSGANLSGANLKQVDLSGANLGGALLNRANLSGADLTHAHLIGTFLYNADLSFADLKHADLRSADLRDMNFNRAWIENTSFGDRDFRVIKGLDTVIHNGPSPLTINSVYLSEGHIPEAFVRGTGAPDTFLDYMRSLAGKPIEYYSCFISYSSKEDAFAQRLYTDLQSNDVRCWFAPEDLKIGAKIRLSVDESIRLHDKLLLVLSQASVTSQWVEQEVERALARERKENKVILFPIRVDNMVMDMEEGWPALIRNTRNIGDFTGWKTYDAYQKAFTRLLRDLKASS